MVLSDYLGTNSTYSMADMVATITIQTPQGFIQTRLGELQSISYSIYQNKAPVRVLGNMNAKNWVFGPRTIAGSLVFAVFNKHWMYHVYDQLKEKAGMKNWHFIADELPPFDVTISFANEYGFESRMAIYGLRIMNEGQTMATNDIYIENTYQYVANDIELMDTADAYTNGSSRHKYVLIAGGTYDPYEENSIVDPIDKEVEEDTGDGTTSEIDIDKLSKTLEISETDLNQMNDRQSAFEELKRRYDAADAQIPSSPDYSDQRQELGRKYQEEYDRIKAYFDEKEANELDQ